MSEGAPSEKARYDPLEAEPRWRDRWERDGLYRADVKADRDGNFVVDTPPPTVSGSLHIGHVFSYTHADILVRQRRMRGFGIFYPMGWDDNGLPTERRVQNIFNVRCDPNLPYEAGLAAEPGAKDLRIVSRRNFIELCGRVTAEDEQAYKALWQRMGLSVDWTEEYATIGAHCRRLSQWSFLDLFRKGRVYSMEAPNLWDAMYQTAVAQAEVEDRQVPGAYHTLRFGIEGEGGPVRIATTRPELLGACVALLVHPEDDRFRRLVGRTAITPLYRQRVPVLASAKVDREKGTGAVMVCTFGDLTDVEWWRELKLPLRTLLTRAGKLASAEAAGLALDAAASAMHAELAGKTVKQAQKRIVEMLREAASSSGDGAPPLEGEPAPVTHAVKFYEKGDLPLEILTTRQWFVRILDLKDKLIDQGRKIAWHPDHMRKRYENWVEGLNMDWCISRQRYFGVPIPVWYPLDAEGKPDPAKPVVAEERSLPVDPLSAAPAGMDEAARGKPGGFAGDPDVFDTWFTSSLTPQIATKWLLEPKRHASLFPTDLRPQSHEIIRTWTFYTIVKSLLHEGEVPWGHVAISGWILDPDRKKMSKSKGNVVTPMGLIDKHSADAVRYWAARARLGTDTAFDETVMANGKRLTTKLFNASRFVLDRLKESGAAPPGPASIRLPLDRLLAARLAHAVERAGKGFEALDYAGALAAAEELFWADFCDNYIELTKHRLYGPIDPPARASALATLALALSVQLRLFAPFIPFATEELWRAAGNAASIHKAPWPSAADWKGAELPASTEAFDHLVAALGEIRRAKTERAKDKSLPPLGRVTVEIDPAKAALLEPLLPDLKGHLSAEVALAATAGAAAPRVAVS